MSNSARGLRGTRVEERTLHERHVLARHERREADELWVGALQGSRDSFPVFFSFGFMCKCVWEAPVGDIVESFKCCRVPRIRVYFYTALSFVCCKLLLYTCDIKLAYLMFPLHSVSFLLIETPSCVT